jgi:hypothetical protein
MYLNLLIISVILLGVAMLGMMLNILVRKKGKFPEYRVGHNRNIRKMGITCVKHEEIRCHKERISEMEGCAGCR